MCAALAELDRALTAAGVGQGLPHKHQPEAEDGATNDQDRVRGAADRMAHVPLHFRAPYFLLVIS